MRKVRELLRLSLDCALPYRQIALSANVGRSTVGDCLARFKASGLPWPLPEEMSDEELEARLYRGENQPQGVAKPLPNWHEIDAELRRKGVTKQLLWIEYKTAHPDGYEYTQFCTLYRRWRKTVDLPFRNEYRAGEKCFVDYAGQQVAIKDPHTGVLSYANVFIAVLGASNYVFCEATWSQNSTDWIGSHIRAFDFFGGVPEVVVPDNLKSGVTKACRYDPVINPSYYEMARYYGCAIIPARVRKPKDKAKVEASVLIVERWILAALRNRTFFSLHELNSAISELLKTLNQRSFRKLPGNREEAFTNIDKPALKALPPKTYEIAEFRIARVNINYHVEFDSHYYSVPYQLVRKEITIRATSHTVEILHGNQRVASHVRHFKKNGYSTQVEHMPAKHQKHVEWNPDRMARWAGEAGPATKAVAESIMSAKPHPQQGFNAVLGLVRLGEHYGKDRLEKAAQRAIKLNSPNFHSVKSILKCGLDAVSSEPEARQTPPIEHGNLRGPTYYN